MVKIFWYFMIILSGTLMGIALAEYLGQRAGETTIYFLISGLILSVISAWGLKKYVGIGFFSNIK